MIRKSTLVVVVIAALLGAAVYYLQRKSAKKAQAPADTTKPAFSMQASDIVSFTISRPANADQPAIAFERKGNDWMITQPVQTQADQPTAQGFADQLAESRIAETEPGGASQKKAYGLDSPQAEVEFQLRKGAKHTLLIGDKDFSGISVYTIIDGSPDVALLPATLLATATKSLDDLRDRNVLAVHNEEVESFALRNPSGTLVLARRKSAPDTWEFSRPEDVRADADSVNLLLSAVAAAKMQGIASEKPSGLPRYGLQDPAIALTITKKDGQQSTLEVGKNGGKEYFARDLSRPQIFRVGQDLYTRLAEKFSDLRDKTVVHWDASVIQQAEVTNANGAVTIRRKTDNPEEWVADAPASEKGKSASIWKVLDPLTSLRAEEVIDHPSPSQLAALKKPAIEAVLTDSNGKTLTVRISKAVGDFAFAQASDSPVLYKVGKQVLENLTWKPGDIAM